MTAAINESSPGTGRKGALPEPSAGGEANARAGAGVAGCP
jgi:hypothetical protein